MDIKKIIENAVKEIQKDGDLQEQFKKDPVKAIEKITGMDLPDDVIEQVINGVKANVDLDKIGDILDKVGLDDAAKALDKVDDVADALKKFF